MLKRLCKISDDYTDTENTATQHQLQKLSDVNKITGARESKAVFRSGYKAPMARTDKGNFVRSITALYCESIAGTTQNMLD